MLVLESIGVAMLVALAVRWKRARLPLLLLLLLLAMLLLLRIHCNQDESEHRAPGPIKHYICPNPNDSGCNEPGATVDAGVRYVR
jgi:hypothetical protein